MHPIYGSLGMTLAFMATQSFYANNRSVAEIRSDVDDRPEPEPYRCGVKRDHEAHLARAEEKRRRKMAKRLEQK